MLASIDVRLFPIENCSLPHPCANKLHAALLDMIRKYNPKLSQILHDDAQVKPYTVSTLWPRTRARGDSLVLPKYTHCRFRVTCLLREVFEAFGDPLFEMVAENSLISIDPCDFRLLEANMTPPFGNITSCEELYSMDEVSSHLRFMSPTTFKSNGVNVPIPIPQMVFSSIWQKWNAYSDVQIEESVFEELKNALVLSQMNCHTRMWKYPAYWMNGFVGNAHFELKGHVSNDVSRLFYALCAFANFSGVGYKTTMGMGQCRVVMDRADGDSEEEEEEEKAVDQVGQSLLDTSK